MARQGLKPCRGLPGASLFWGSGSAAQNLQEGIFFAHRGFFLAMLAVFKSCISRLAIVVCEAREARRFI